MGALVGFAIGSLIDGASGLTEYAETQRRPHTNTQEGDFKMSLLVMIACVMKADGSPKKTELAIVKRFLVVNFGEAGALEGLQILKKLLQQNINEQAVAMQINQYMNYSSKLELLHLLDRFPETAGNAALALAPHHISHYLMEVAGALHSYYANTPVLNAPDEALVPARLALLRAVGQVIRNGLDLLGVSAPETM